MFDWILRLIVEKASDRPETTAELKHSVTTSTAILPVVTPAVTFEDVPYTSTIPATISLPNKLEPEHANTSVNTNTDVPAPARSQKMGVDDGTAASAEGVRKEVEEKKHLLKEEKMLQMEKERLRREGDERLQKEDIKQIRKTDMQGPNSNTDVPTWSPKVDINRQDGTKVDVSVLKKGPANGPLLAGANVNNSSVSSTVCAKIEESQKHVDQKDAKKWMKLPKMEAGEKVQQEEERVAAAEKKDEKKARIRIQEESLRRDKKENELKRLKAEASERSRQVAEEAARKAVEAEAKREQEVRDRKLKEERPRKEEESAWTRSDAEEKDGVRQAEEKARQAAEAEAKREREERSRKLSESAQIRLEAEEKERLRQAEERARQAAEAKAKREREERARKLEESARIRLEAEEKERLRKAAAEKARQVAEAEAKRERQVRARMQEESARIRLETEEKERLRKVAEEQARQAAEAKAKREREDRAPMREESARIRLEAEEKERLRKVAAEKARQAVEAEAKREREDRERMQEKSARRRLEADEKERLQKAAEEKVRQAAEAEARRTQEERLSKENEEKEQSRKDAEENARKVAEAIARREKERVRISAKKNERARKVAIARVKSKQIDARRKEEKMRVRAHNLKQEQERLRQEAEKEPLRREELKKDDAERIHKAGKETTNTTELERIEKEEEYEAAAGDEGPSKHGTGLRITTTELRKDRHSSLDSFYASGSDPASESLPSALSTASIIDDIDNVIYRDSIKTQKAADPDANSNVQFKYDRDFLLQFMRNLTRSAVAPPNAPAVAVLQDEHADPAIHFDKLQPSISHKADPIEWTRLNRECVANAIPLLLGQEKAATCKVSKVYPRLTVYTLACIKCNSNLPEGTKLVKLSGTLRMLESLNPSDDISALANHHIVRSYLLTSIHEMRGTRDDDHEGPYGMTLERVLKMDANAIDALLLATLQNPVMYKHVVKRLGQEAQSLLNLLQARLGFPLDASLKHYYTGALIKLSRNSGLYPECMTLKGIKLTGDSAVDAGGFGDIWRGLLKDKEIAVKVLRIVRQSDKDKVLKEFSSEAVIWRQLNHRNVLPFCGVFHLEDHRLCITSPWMKNGNVVRFLEAAPETKCVPLILDIAEGLSYLHTLKPAIIHGDLKGANILITDSRRACLADFGLATAKDSKSFAITTAVSIRTTGTLRWQAPELLDPESDDALCVNSMASDVYAYACVCYEIFSGRIPFQEIAHDFRVMAAITQGKRPSHPDDHLSRVRGLDNGIWTIIETCWARDPRSRLTAYQIVERLRSSPACVIDDRPVDYIDSSFPSRALYSQAEHPFSALSGVKNDDR